MKLTLKLMMAIVAVIFLLFSIHSYLRLQREIGLFKSNMRSDADLVGGALASSFTDIWTTDGPTRVFHMIQDANKAEKPISIRWVWLDELEGDSSRPMVDPEHLKPLLKGENVYSEFKDSSGEKFLVYYHPVRIENVPPAALEIAQSYMPMYNYTRGTILRKAVFLIAILLAGGLMVLLLGMNMVGRPVHDLVEHARKVGKGDLTAQLDIGSHRDELSILAGEMNAMTEQLRVSQEELSIEQSKRISLLEELHHTERLAAVGKIASEMAHELGTPLNVVSSRAKMIASRTLPQDATTENAQIVKEQADRMAAIIRRLLDFARRRSSKKAPVEIDSFIRNIVTVLKPLASQQNIQINLQANGIKSEVEIDKEQIQQVLTNLLTNAIQAMHKGGKIQVMLNVEHDLATSRFGDRKGDYLCIKIKDEGEGIPSDSLDKIFLPFFTTKRMGEGTGLGLSIANDIVREHGGWMDVESEPGKGSCFSIYIPMENRK
jgi:two-component system NtrC family sensor kinase